jgi:hypothetical protein
MPGGSSLSQLLADERAVRKASYLPPLTLQQILSWADSHWQRTGCWPTLECGLIAEDPGETWRQIDNALRLGLRALASGSSLARLFARRRGARNQSCLPRLSERQIVIWADGHYRRTGRWPTNNSGNIPKVRGETWKAVRAALQVGRRAFPGCDSLARLLARERGVTNRKDPPPLSVAEIRRWAGAYHRRTGNRPTSESGPILEASGETWSMVNRALMNGKRRLRGRSSLFRLLRQRADSPEKS